jgi:hypothetical protein
VNHHYISTPFRRRLRRGRRWFRGLHWYRETGDKSAGGLGGGGVEVYGCVSSTVCPCPLVSTMSHCHILISSFLCWYEYSYTYNALVPSWYGANPAVLFTYWEYCILTYARTGTVIRTTGNYLLWCTQYSSSKFFWYSSTPVQFSLHCMHTCTWLLRVHQ